MGEEVWRRHPKSQKQLKCKGVVPDLRVYKGLVVVFRGECGLIGGVRLVICDLK